MKILDLIKFVMITQVSRNSLLFFWVWKPGYTWQTYWQLTYFSHVVSSSSESRTVRNGKEVEGNKSSYTYRLYTESMCAALLRTETHGCFLFIFFFTHFKLSSVIITVFCSTKCSFYLFCLIFFCQEKVFLKYLFCCWSLFLTAWKPS